VDTSVLSALIRRFEMECGTSALTDLLLMEREEAAVSRLARNLLSSIFVTAIC